MDPTLHHAKGFFVLMTATMEPSMNLPKLNDWIFRYNGSFFNFMQQLAKIAYGPNLSSHQRIFCFDDCNYGTFHESSLTKRLDFQT